MSDISLLPKDYKEKEEEERARAEEAGRAAPEFHIPKNGNGNGGNGRQEKKMSASAEAPARAPEHMPEPEEKKKRADESTRVSLIPGFRATERPAVPRRKNIFLRFVVAGALIALIPSVTLAVIEGRRGKDTIAARAELNDARARLFAASSGAVPNAALASRTATFAELLKNHAHPSVFFRALESATLPNVRWNSATVTEKQISLQMSADSPETIADEAILLERSGAFSSVTLGAISEERASDGRRIAHTSVTLVPL